MSAPAHIARPIVAMTNDVRAPVRRPPLLGEHTDAILTDLGYDAAAIAELREKSVV